MSGVLTDNLGRASGLVKAPGGGGAWAVVAHTNIAGSVSEVAFTGLNVYPVYRFFINNIRIDGGSSGELRMRASDDNGSTYKSGVNYDWAHTYADARDEHGRYGSEDADTIVIIKDIGNPSSAEVTMYIPDASGETTARTTWTGTAQSTTSPGSVVSGQAMGARTRDFGDQSDPVDAVKFYPSTGNFEGCGQITVLGMKTS